MSLNYYFTFRSWKLLFSEKLIILLLFLINCQPNDSYTSKKIRKDSLFVEFSYSTLPSDLKSDTLGVMLGKDYNKSDLSTSFKSAWDNKNIYFLIKVNDDIKLNYQDAQRKYENDAVSLFFSTNFLKKRDDEGIVSFIFFYNVSDLNFSRIPTAKNGVAYKIKDIFGGYFLEIKIPWTAIGIIPRDKLTIPFNIEVSDLDLKQVNGVMNGRESVLSWSPESPFGPVSDKNSLLYRDLILH